MWRKLKAVVALLAIATFMISTRIETRAQGERYLGTTITGTVYFVGGLRPARSYPLTLRINRFATDSEVAQLNQALQSGGQDELLSVLSGMNCGRVQIGTGVGVTANAIIATRVGERTKITVVYERYLQFAELRYGTRSQDYRFGYAEMFLGRDGNEGMVIPASKIRLRDGDTWEVEDFATFPARLMGLKVRGESRSTVR
jgi:hypothetical protein